MTLAKAFGEWCVKQGMIRVNPLTEIEPQGERQRCKQQLRVDEARKLITTCCKEAEKGDTSAVAVMTALLLGPRSTEVVSREVRDLDNDGWLLWITKSKTKAGERTLEIPAFLRPYLQRLAKDKQPTDRLFGDNSRRRLPHRRQGARPHELQHDRKHYVQPGTVERVAQGKVLGILAPEATKKSQAHPDQREGRWASVITQNRPLMIS